jgi:hypothetical protein
LGRRKGQGRGRLSTIDLLPPEATPDIQWAVDELLAKERTQVDILEEFNQRLAVLGLEPISVGAFSRHSMRIAAQTRRMKEAQDITTAIASRFGPDNADRMTTGLVAILKQAVFEIGETGKHDPENILFLARSLQALVGAQKTSADVRRLAEKELDAKLKATAKAVDSIAKEKGLTRETIDAIKGTILGVKAGARAKPAEVPHVASS